MADPNEELHPDHERILRERVVGAAGYPDIRSQSHPRAIILAGQPGAGKGKLADSALQEMHHQAVVVDPDELRRLHPEFKSLTGQHPYTWADHTHPDASQWTKELRADAIS